MGDKTFLDEEVVDLEKRPPEDLEDDLDVVLSGGIGGRSASLVFCICESII